MLFDNDYSWVFFLKRGGQRDSTEDKTLALHIPEPRLIPGTPYDPTCPTSKDLWTQLGASLGITGCVLKQEGERKRDKVTDALSAAMFCLNNLQRKSLPFFQIFKIKFPLALHRMFLHRLVAVVKNIF